MSDNQKLKPSLDKNLQRCQEQKRDKKEKRNPSSKENLRGPWCQKREKERKHCPVKHLLFMNNFDSQPYAPNALF